MPYHRHDCFNPHCCHYVGSTLQSGKHGDLMLDVYVSQNGTGEDALIIRFGDAADYITMSVAFYRSFMTGINRDNKPPTVNTERIRLGLVIYDQFHAALRTQESELL